MPFVLTSFYAYGIMTQTFEIERSDCKIGRNDRNISQGGFTVRNILGQEFAVILWTENGLYGG